MKKSTHIGLGFRRDFAVELLESDSVKPDFIELAPENWMGIGGYWRSILDQAAEKFPITSHGLSLSIGSPDELDISFVKQIKQFLDEYKIEIYSEHLSYSNCNNAHLYDLLPIPFRADAVKHIVERIRIVQDILERQLVLENVSYYTPVGAEMSEVDFISNIINESGCGLLLDVNNVYVNAFNHSYNAEEFIQSLPLEQVKYMHMAGHEKVADDLIIDTHGQPIIDPVYELFEFTTSIAPNVPVLLERDFNIPELSDLQAEMDQLRTISSNQWSTNYATKG